MKFTYNNKSYTLNPERAIKLGVVIPDVIHQVGNRYTHNGNVYILASSGAYNHVLLINLSNGWTYGAPYPVKNWDNISTEEWSKISDNKFTICN